jgi:ribonuclease R
MTNSRVTFPQAILREVRSLSFRDELFSKRAQAKGFTIDGPTSRDLDDAIYLERNGNDFILHVSIADVDSIVKMGSAVDTEANRRAFTRYYGYWNDPMIPHELSEGLLSLFEGQVRPTLTASIPISRDMQVGKAEIKRTVLKSLKRFNYAEVDSILKNRKGELYELLMGCDTLSQALLSSRREKGALAIYDINKGIATTEEGNIIDLEQDERHISNLIIQEFMILANQSVAEFCAENNIPVLYRNHEAKPSAPGKPNELLLQVQQAMQFPGKFSLETARKGVNLNLQRARYARTLKGHYGLNLPAYLHFTSPIRRLPDLISHRNIIAFLERRPFPYSVERLDEIASHVNQTQDEIKDKRDEHFARLNQKQVAVAVIENDFSTLDESQFSDAIDIALTSNNLSINLELEINERIQKKILPLTDFLNILLISKKDSDVFVELKKTVLLELVKDLPNAVYVLSMVKQKFEGYSSPEFVTSGVVIDQPFTSIAKIQKDKTSFASDSCKARNKKRAEQLASLNLLAKLSGVEVGELNLGEDLTVSKSDGKSEFSFSGLKIKLPWKSIDAVRKDLQDNPKGKLLELITINPPLSKLSFDTEKVDGGDHNPVFSSTATILDNSLKAIEGTSSDKLQAANRKDAEHLASANLLSKLIGETVTFSGASPLTGEEKPVEVTRTRQPHENNIVNPKGQILELVKKKKWTNFQSVYNRTGGEDHNPEFTAQVSVRINREEIKSDEVVMKARALHVEQFACAGLLTKLIELRHLREDEVLFTGENALAVQTSDLIKRVKERITETNFTGALFEACQGLGLNTPKVDETSVKHEGVLVHKVTVEITNREGQAFSEAKVMPKKVARNLASKEVLIKAWSTMFPDEKNPFLC